MALISMQNSNFILLDQLRKSGIIYYNNFSIMTLIRDNKTIAYIKRGHKLFTINLTISSQIILAISSKAIVKTD